MFDEFEMEMFSKATPPEFLKMLYQKIGQAGFEDSKRLNAYISDFLNENSGIKQHIKYAISCNIHRYVLREPCELLSKNRLQQIISMVKDQTGMGNEAAEEFVLLFAYATGRSSTYSLNKIYYQFFRPVKISGKYGYADEKNNVVIHPKYDRAKPFSCDRAKICIGGKFGFLDRYGDEVILAIYDKANDFKGDTTEVVLNGERIIIDKNGEICC